MTAHVADKHIGLCVDKSEIKNKNTFLWFHPQPPPKKKLDNWINATQNVKRDYSSAAMFQMGWQSVVLNGTKPNMQILRMPEVT